MFSITSALMFSVNHPDGAVHCVHPRQGVRQPGKREGLWDETSLGNRLGEEECWFGGLGGRLAFDVVHHLSIAPGLHRKRVGKWLPGDLDFPLRSHTLV